MVSKLNEIIKANYADGEKFIDTLIEFDLDVLMSNVIHQVERCIENQDLKRLSQVSGTILTSINTKIGCITDLDKKQAVEYLLSDIFDTYLKLVGQQLNGKEALKDINENLKYACELNNYKFEELANYLNIEKNMVLLPKLSKQEKYYDWQREREELINILNDMRSMKIIASSKSFLKIFKPSAIKLSIECSPEKKDLLLVIFSVLKDKKLIKPKGGSGYLSPLFYHTVDNENLSLFPEKINKLHEKIKRNNTNYLKIRAKAEELINANLHTK